MKFETHIIAISIITDRKLKTDMIVSDFSKYSITAEL
jgi:hypothetical protein